MNRFITPVFLFATLCTHAQSVADFVSVSNPDDVEVDRFGNVWVDYHTSNTIDTFHLAKITPAGLFVDVISTTTQLGPFGINDSIIWISSQSAGKVYKYNHAGNLLDSVNVTSPSEIILDPDGTWYLSQDQSGRIVQYSPANAQIVLASGIPLDNNLALARDEHGIFYTCNQFNADVIRIDPTTGMKTVIATLPTANPYSTGYLSYSNGYLYVPSGVNCIYKVDTSGLGFTVFAGVEGMSGDVNGHLTGALFNGPKGVSFSATGDSLFFTDANNNKIKKISGMGSLGLSDPGQPGNELVLYPNPSKDILHVATKNDVPFSVRVYDRNGSLVPLPQMFISNTTELALSGIPAGAYYVTVITEKGNVYHSGFIRSE